MFGHAARKVVGKSLWLPGKVCFLSIQHKDENVWACCTKSRRQIITVTSDQALTLNYAERLHRLIGFLKAIHDCWLTLCH